MQDMAQTSGGRVAAKQRLVGTLYSMAHGVWLQEINSDHASLHTVLTWPSTPPNDQNNPHMD